MPFVKLDTGILDSTLWMDRASREIFITSLLMAEPIEIEQPMEQIEVQSMKPTGFVVPPGWYGFVRAAGVGIIQRAMIDREEGIRALQSLGSPEEESRSRDHGGRRLVRVDGGFVVLNFMKYRERDYTGAERSRRYRNKRKQESSLRDATLQRSDAPLPLRDITQAEAEAEADKSKIVCMAESQIADDSDSLIQSIWRSHPANAHRKGLINIPPDQAVSIMEALLRHGEEAVVSGTRGYAQVVAKWPMEGRARNVKSVLRFYRESDYMRDPREWEQSPRSVPHGKQPVSAGAARSERSKQNILDGLAANDRRANAPMLAKLKG